MIVKCLDKEKGRYNTRLGFDLGLEIVFGEKRDKLCQERKIMSREIELICHLQIFVILYIRINLHF
jgi:hypothetical protein